ncbi:hypothetical protein, partial [Salmonella sp. SAL4435]|uniref:hypothetical protein n=1 Tax=Salmonella sp. SAL4435 TaxID=3159890 RepID=UPI003979F294
TLTSGPALTPGAARPAGLAERRGGRSEITGPDLAGLTDPARARRAPGLGERRRVLALAIGHVRLGDLLGRVVGAAGLIRPSG